jgi:hypothetical protein
MRRTKEELCDKPPVDRRKRMQLRRAEILALKRAKDREDIAARKDGREV